MNPSAPKKHLRVRPNCKVCQAIAIDPKLKVRIYATSYYNENGSESLRDIARDYDGAFTQAGLSNHCRKHQLGPRANTRNNKLAILRSSMDRDGEIKRQLHQEGRITEIPRENYETAWNTILALGAERLAKGELKVSGSMVLKAAKDKADYQSHSRDKQLEIAKMMYNFASAESNELIEESDATAEPTEGGTGRPDGPGDIYSAIAGDATAPRPAEVYPQDHQRPDPYQPTDLR